MNQKIHYNKSHILIHDADDDTETLNNKNFISSRCDDVFSRFARVIICLIIVLIVILIGTISIYCFSDKSAQNYHCNEDASPFCNKLIFSDENQIRTYDLSTGHSNFLWEDKNDVTTFDVGEKTIFWSEENVPIIRDLHESLNLTHSKKLKPQAIALDSLTKKFYIVDKVTGTLSVIDMNNKYYGIVLSDLVDPSDIVLDIQEGLMFITQHLQSIVRANLDGTNATTIAKSQGVSAIALDYKEKKIFWAVTFVSDDYGIICANYDGKNRTILTELSIPVRSLTILDNNLFWLSSENWKRNASIWSCNLNHGTCKNHTKFPLFFHKPKTIKTYVPQISADSELSNPCEVNNGNCSDLCFVGYQRIRTCACRVGYQLNPDQETCKLVSSYLIYMEKNHVRGIIPDSKPGSTFRDTVIPTPLTLNYLSFRNFINFDYDVQRDNFYYSDSSSIYLMKLINDGDTRVLVKTKTFDRINSLAYDRMSNNVYYSYTSGAYVEENSIMLMHVSDRMDGMIILKTAHPFEVNRDNNNPARCLAVSPNKGLVFFTKWEAGKDVHVMNVNGTERKNLHTLPYISTDKLILALDSDEEWIYVGYSSEKIFIFRANYNFTDVQPMNDTIPMTDIKSMYVHEDHLYVSNSSTIWRMDKRTGANPTKIVPNYDKIADKTIYGVKVYSMGVDHKGNQCAVNNGDCEEFCFSKPLKACGCGDKKELQASDGRCFLSGIVS